MRHVLCYSNCVPLIEWNNRWTTFGAVKTGKHALKSYLALCGGDYVGTYYNTITTDPCCNLHAHKRPRFTRPCKRPKVISDARCGGTPENTTDVTPDISTTNEKKPDQTRLPFHPTAQGPILGHSVPHLIMVKGAGVGERLQFSPTPLPLEWLLKQKK